jgi:hypothetical protein
VPLEHRDQVADAIELMGAGEATRARAHDGYAAAGAPVRHLGLHPALLERVVDDGALDVLDGDRLGVDAESARALARRRAHAARELGEVVGLQELVEGLFPVALVHQVIPLGDDVAERAAVLGLAEGDATVHASGRLLLQALVVVNNIF